MKYHPGSMGIILALAITIMFLPPNVVQPRGQTVIQLGGDFQLTKSRLANNGYYRIDLVGQGFTKFHVEACQNGVRYWFKSDGNGNVNQKRKIGACQPNQQVLSKKSIRRLLATQGYDRIKIEQHGNISVAVVCVGNDRLRVEINQQGQVGNRRQIGNCRNQLDPRNLTNILENLGFSHVKIVSDRPPTYIAEVCEKQTRVELTLDRFGEIIERISIGNCARKISARRLIRSMRDQGYVRINIKRETNRGYLAQACHSGQLYRIEYDIYGTLRDERQKGPCPS